jgi:predicted Zn-dependent protease with MMP-like domain
MNVDSGADLAAIEAMAQAAFQTIPSELRDQVKSVVFQVVELPDAETCRELRLESPFDLLGLYRGVPISEQSAWDAPQDLDRIFLYRLPILRYVEETGEDLPYVVRHVLIHEIGHHFGLSDDDMEAIERGA